MIALSRRKLSAEQGARRVLAAALDYATVVA
jgi:hypothetical protein